MADTNQDDAFRAAQAELAKVRDAWLRRPEVTAVDVGLERRGGQLTQAIAVRVHVRRKLPAAQLAPHELFPERLGTVPVDVIQAAPGLEPA